VRFYDSEELAEVSAPVRQVLVAFPDVEVTIDATAG
jgi:hypothetical protein